MKMVGGGNSVGVGVGGISVSGIDGNFGVGGGRVVATLRADGKIYHTITNKESLAATPALTNYKIRTDGEVQGKNNNPIALPTTVVDMGKQLLQYARDRDLKGVKIMMTRGAPFTSDWLGMTALHFAAMNGEFAMCDTLLKGGINKDSRTKVDRTALHLAVFYGHQHVVELLLNRKCAVNARDMLRMTPLHWAVEKNHKNIVTMLLNHNADVTVLSKFGKTPMGLAVHSEQTELLNQMELARQMQSRKRYCEENERETCDAVNSIMEMNGDDIIEADSINSADFIDHFTVYPDASMTSGPSANFANVTETGIIDSGTIDLLKTHGISMINESEDDGARDMLNTALRNGRQLVLSEGGKMLLKDTNMLMQNVMNNNCLKSNNNNNNHNNINNNRQQRNINSNNNNNKSQGSSTAPIIMDRRSSNSSTASTQSRSNLTAASMQTSGATTSQGQNYPKIRSSGIVKGKNAGTMPLMMGSIVKNNGKNSIRIISLNDFKKLYKESDIPLNPQLFKHVSQDGRNIIVKKAAVQQVRLPTTIASTAAAAAAAAPMPDIAGGVGLAEINMNPNDDNSSMNTNSIAAATTTATNLPRANIKTAASMPTMGGQFHGPVNRHVKISNPALVINARGGEMKNDKISIMKPLNITANSNLVPGGMANTEVMRLVAELRQQNVDLKHRVEELFKDKEEMRQRLDRIEAYLLTDKDDSFVDI